MIDILTRFAVPGFMLITGSFIFQKAENMPKKEFYLYALRKVIVPTLLYSAGYCAFLYAKGTLSVLMLNDVFDWKEPLVLWLHGKPFGHLWYMYMLMGLYLFIPVILWVRKHLTLRLWFVVGVICLMASSIVNLSNLLGPVWIFCWIQYIGYFIIGDVIHRVWKRQSMTVAILSFIAAGIAFLMMLWVCKKSYTIFQPKSLLAFVLSFGIYFGFYNLNIQKDNKVITILARRSAEIYFLHGGVITVINILMNFRPVQYKYQILYYLFGEASVIFTCLIVLKIVEIVKNKIIGTKVNALIDN